MMSEPDFDTRAVDWFERNPRLTMVNVCIGEDYWSIRRGAAGVNRESLGQWDNEEWLRYQEDGYSCPDI